MQFTRLEHRFCTHIPENLRPGVLYISMEFATAAHSCCCGCGEEVVTPFTPTDWRMVFDGQTISLWPSVGNWTLQCRSHYVVRNGVAIEAPPWTDEEIAAERRRDRAAKARFYESAGTAVTDDDRSGGDRNRQVKTNWWHRFRNWASCRLRKT